MESSDQPLLHAFMATVVIEVVAGDLESAQRLSHAGRKGLARFAATPPPLF
jgi:hypothetical protein